METEGDVIILLVGEGTLGNLVNVVLVGAVILRMIVINYDVLHVYAGVLNLEMVSREYWMLWMRLLVLEMMIWTHMKKMRLKVYSVI